MSYLFSYTIVQYQTVKHHGLPDRPLLQTNFLLKTNLDLPPLNVPGTAVHLQYAHYAAYAWTPDSGQRAAGSS